MTHNEQLDAICADIQQHEIVLKDFLKNEGYHKIQEAARVMIKGLIDNKILAIGNGGSMSDAMHFASELSGKFRAPRPAIAAIALSDPSALTCIANDFGYNQVFKRQIEALGRDGDILLALSTSGNSENILVAAEYAKMRGMKVVSICGKHGKLREYSDVVIEIPHEGTADRTQEITILVIHILVMLIEKEI